MMLKYWHLKWLWYRIITLVTKAPPPPLPTTTKVTTTAILKQWFITLIIVNDDQQDAPILDYLFIPSQLYMFRAMSLPIIKSTWLNLQLLVLSTVIAAAGIMDEMELKFHLIHDIGRQYQKL